MSGVRLNQLRAFVAVARTGGVSSAAKRLHVSQPAVSALVHQLEDRYGVELFMRVGRGLRLTDLGKRLLNLVMPLLEIEEDALQLLSDAGTLRSGTLRMGAVSPYHVTDILAEFSRRYPRVTVQVKFGNSDMVLKELLDGQIDVGVMSHSKRDARLHVLPFRRDPIVALVPKCHPWAKRSRLSFSDLDGQRIVVREQGSTARRIVEAEMRRVGVRPDVVMELGSREAIREAVARGIGIGTVAEAAFASDPRLKSVRFNDSAIELVTHLFCLRSRLDAQGVKAFFEIADSLASTELQPRSQRP